MSSVVVERDAEVAKSKRGKAAKLVRSAKWTKY